MDEAADGIFCPFFFLVPGAFGAAPKPVRDLKLGGWLRGYLWKLSCYHFLILCVLKEFFVVVLFSCII